MSESLPTRSVPAVSEREDRRWLYLHRLNAIRGLCFGDGIHTTSGLVKGEDDSSQLAALLNQLQADLGIASGVEPTPKTATITVTCGRCGGDITSGPQWGHNFVGCPKCDSTTIGRSNPS